MPKVGLAENVNFLTRRWVKEGVQESPAASIGSMIEEKYIHFGIKARNFSKVGPYTPKYTFGTQSYINRAYFRGVAMFSKSGGRALNETLNMFILFNAEMFFDWKLENNGYTFHMTPIRLILDCFVMLISSFYSIFFFSCLTVWYVHIFYGHTGHTVCLADLFMFYSFKSSSWSEKKDSWHQNMSVQWIAYSACNSAVLGVLLTDFWQRKFMILLCHYYFTIKWPIFTRVNTR